MKKSHIFAFFVGTLLIPAAACASPVINSIKLSPSSNIWIGESLTLQVNCTDNENYNISNVYAQIIGENGYRIPDKTFTLKNGLYTALIESLYLNEPNKFTSTVFCVNNISNQVSQITSFEVSSFTVDIASVNPTTIYLGDQIEIYLSIKKNDDPITSGVTFSILVNGQPKDPKILPPYDPNKGWIIYLDSPSTSGSHNLRITAFYDRINSTVSRVLTINDPIQFKITNIDKTWVKTNDTINLQIQAFDRGTVIPINTNNLAVKIGPSLAEIISITPISNYFHVAILASSRPSGTYSITASLSYKNYTYTDSKTIHYIVFISGKFLDENGKGIAAQLNFISNGVEKLRLYTDSNGVYSGSIPPGTYDIKAVFPQSTLYLYEVDVDSFDNPIKHFYLTLADIPGLDLTGLYVYDVAVSYYKASIEMRYDERNILNEDSIKVYKCANWNTGKKICNSNWTEVDAIIDRVRNTVYVNTTSLSAYAIGSLKHLSIDFNMNKEKYYLKDLVKLRGMVLDNHRNAVSNASVDIYVKGTDIKMKTVSDNNGVFTLEFLSPNNEGNYTLFLTAKKYPYTSFNSSSNLEVVKKKEISIVFPDTVKIKEGGRLNQDFSVANTGQVDLYNLSISLSGIPSEYYTINFNIEKLAVGEEKKFSISFSVPYNVSLGTSSATLKIYNEEVSKEKIFGFTILGMNETASSPIPTTGRFVLPKINPDFIYITIFAAISFSLAFILKKRKIKNQNRDNIKNFLSDVKTHVKGKAVEKSNKPKTLEANASSTLTNNEIPLEKTDIVELKDLEKMI